MNRDHEPPIRVPDALPRWAAALLAASLTGGEREEVLADLAAEHRARRRSSGRLIAWLWVWRQALASLPALLGRGWWRGWSGFEPPAERLQPGGPMLESLAIDVRFALRRLRRRPTYTALTVITLALGVAGTAAVYGIARELLFSPLPVRAEEEVVAFWRPGAWSQAGFAAIRPVLADGFTAVAAVRSADATLRRGDAPAVLVEAHAGTHELFAVLGVRPALGTGFGAGADRPGGEAEVVLSHSLWRELGASPAMLGERLELSGQPRTVVGVMPEGFWYPDPQVRAWLSDAVDPANEVGNYGLVGRLAPGRDIAAMEPVLQRIATVLGERFQFAPGWDLREDMALTPLRDDVLGPVRPAVLALLAAMAVILLVACANVAALMLGQVDSRGTELAMRSALGAPRRRLLQQLAVESLCLGALAGVVGAGLASFGVQFLVRALPLGALGEAARPGWSLFAAAIAVAVIAAAGIAVVPGSATARRDLRGRLGSSRTGGVAGRGGRLEHGLVVAQVALVLLLTGGAALLIRSVDNRQAIDPGVDVAGVAVLDVELPATLGAAEIPPVLRRLVDAAAALPGVQEAAATQRLPLRGPSDNWGLGIEGKPDFADTTVAFRVVSPEYRDALGIELRAGRWLADSDRDPGAAEGVIVVNEAAARKFFPGEDPLGRRLAYSNRWDRIVGVVGNVAEGHLQPEAVPAAYAVHEQVPYLLSWQTIVLKMRPGADPVAALEGARRAIQAAAPEVAVREATTMASVFTRAIGPAVQVRALLSLLAGLGLALGAIGIYGVVSHFVARSRREWTIRMALGLPPSRVAGAILGRGGALIAAGLAIGLIAFAALARLLATFLYGVEASDPMSLVAAAGVLAAAGLLAAAVPARRASRVDPAVVLRES